MVAFIIFWAALFCILFFLLGTVFKGLASLFDGLISSAIYVISTAIMVGLGEIALFAVYAIASGVRTSGIGAVLGMMAILFIELALTAALLGGLGSLLLGIILSVLEAVIDIISGALEGAASACEKAYAYFLFVIMQRLDKC